MDLVLHQWCWYVSSTVYHGCTTILRKLTSGETACIFGASVVCIDILIRVLPGKSNFRIQESNAFLACSLSLSFGVMVSLPCLAIARRIRSD